MFKESTEMIRRVRENERLEQEKIYLHRIKQIDNYYKNNISDEDDIIRIKKFIIEAIDEKCCSDEFYPEYNDYALATFLEPAILYELILKHKLENILVIKKNRITLI